MQDKHLDSFGRLLILSAVLILAVLLTLYFTSSETEARVHEGAVLVMSQDAAAGVAYASYDLSGLEARAERNSCIAFRPLNASEGPRAAEVIS